MGAWEGLRVSVSALTPNPNHFFLEKPTLTLSVLLLPSTSSGNGEQGLVLEQRREVLLLGQREDDATLTLWAPPTLPARRDLLLRSSHAGHTFYDRVLSLSSRIKILFTTCQTAY